MKETRKLEFIDALRGFAALYVFSFHFSLITNPNAVAPAWLAPFTGLGGSGVTLFFVVSAFTLSLSMDSRRGDEANPLRNYFLRRYFRIAPLFYLWIVIYCIRDKIVFDSVHSVRDIARSALFVLNLAPGHESGFVWASWTIGVEMLFYLAFPVIFRFANTIGSAAAFFLLALLFRPAWHSIVFFLVTDPTVAQQFYSLSLLRHLPTFLFGIVVYRAYRLLDVDGARRRGAGWLMIAASLSALLAMAYGVLDVGQVQGLTAEALVYGVLLLGLAISAPAILVNRLTCFYGKISYSVYLSHATTLYFMSKIFSNIYARIPVVTISYGVSFALGLAVVTSISALTYRFIEKPGTNIARKIIRRRDVARA